MIKKISIVLISIIIFSTVLLLYPQKEISTKHSIAQMIMVRGDEYNEGWTNLNVGGIFLDKQPSLADYRKLIQQYQNKSSTQLIIATDYEGAWTPFPFRDDNIPLSHLSTKEQAYELGQKQGRLLKETGFNLNFAPIAEYTDEAYGGRAFTQNQEELLPAYIKGLQTSLKGTCKHYPGKAMIKNLHLEEDTVNITKEDLELFQICIKNNISAIMVSHQITTGEIDSNNRPSTVSREVISSLNDFDGLIIADEINMQALKNKYLNKTELYIDLINAGNNFILDFEITPKELKEILTQLKNHPRLNQTQLNLSLKKIQNYQNVL